MRARTEETVGTKEQTARDRVGNASAALFDVESMLPHDSDERKAVYRMRIGLNTMKERLVQLATIETQSAG